MCVDLQTLVCVLIMLILICTSCSILRIHEGPRAQAQAPRPAGRADGSCSRSGGSNSEVAIAWACFQSCLRDHFQS